MKLLCIQDSVTEREGIPLINRKDVTKRIGGLTKGKEYKVLLTTSTHGSVSNGFGSIKTDQRFLVFNDDSVWEIYDLDLFAPEEE